MTHQRAVQDVATHLPSERDILLWEVLHRVNNNLQQIEGLIAIEGCTFTDPKALHSFEALIGRVRAMGAVYHRLLSSKHLTDISARDFIQDLCRDLSQSKDADRRCVSIRVEVDPGVINIESGVVLGLLVNELVTNAMTHAFPDGRSGEVVVSYKQLDRESMLEVRDNGVGLSESSIDSAKSNHSGFRLIEGFVDQLGGRLRIDSTSGVVAQVTFPELPRPMARVR